MRLKNIFSFVTMYLFALSLMAQEEAAVKNFTMTTDHIPVADRRNDFNNDPCALVKIQVLDDIERVEGNVIGDIVVKGVEKWVYMCKGSRNVKIHFRNHLPVRIIFQDYNVNGLESNRVYELVIHTPNEGSPMPTSQIKSGEFRLSINPASAIVTVWSEDTQRKSYHTNDDGTLTIRLPYGRYYYEVSANTYYKQEGNVFISDSPYLENYTLQHTQEWFEEQKRLEEERQAEERRQEEARRLEEIRLKAIADSIAKAKADSIAFVKEQQRIEEARIKAEREAEQARIKAEREAEQARIKAEQEAEQARIKAEQEAERARIKAEKEAERALIKKQKHEALMAKLAEQDKKTVVLGIKAGYNSATAQFDSKYKGTTGVVGGFHLGMTADMRLSDSFHLCSGLIYSSKGYTYENISNDINEEGKGQFIDIPLQASIRLPLGNTVKLTINAGPYTAICAGGDVEDKWDNHKESFSSAYSGFDYGLQLGIGFVFRHHIQIGTDYQIGMGSNYQNRNLMIGVGYRF